MVVAPNVVRVERVALLVVRERTNVEFLWTGVDERSDRSLEALRRENLALPAAWAKPGTARAAARGLLDAKDPLVDLHDRLHPPCRSLPTHRRQVCAERSLEVVSPRRVRMRPGRLAPLRVCTA